MPREGSLTRQSKTLASESNAARPVWASASMSQRLLRLALGQDAVLAFAHLRVGPRPVSFISFLLEIAVRFALLRARPTRGYSSGIGRGLACFPSVGRVRVVHSLALARKSITMARESNAGHQT